ncbi:MAG: amidotransferase [Nitrospiraceae bacterium]|nr:MAG: amidotransferase [Nitrospiraceae bacterium]
MRAHYFQHVAFEGLGSIETWLRAAGCEITGTRFFESADLPALDEVEFLIVMGGPMSVHDDAEYPWLVQEKQFIRSCILAGKPVLGVCLGAQLIAHALGAKVYRHHTKEIGWFPVQAVPTSGEVFRFPPSVEVFHWHGETFDLPPGAMLLARSEACAHQAFQIGRSVIGLQFHLETTPELARQMIAHCRAELVPSRYVQSEAEILSAPPQRYREANKLMAKVLRYLTRSDQASE